MPASRAPNRDGVGPLGRCLKDAANRHPQSAVAPISKIPRAAWGRIPHGAAIRTCEMAGGESSIAERLSVWPCRPTRCKRLVQVLAARPKRLVAGRPMKSGVWRMYATALRARPESKPILDPGETGSAVAQRPYRYVPAKVARPFALHGGRLEGCSAGLG